MAVRGPRSSVAANPSLRAAPLPFFPTKPSFGPLAFRSIASHCGSELAENILSAYGTEHVDRRKLSSYRLLDEFF